MIKYFVSFSFEYGNGDCVYETQSPINKMSDIEHLRKLISHKLHKENITILNIMKLKKKKRRKRSMIPKFLKRKLLRTKFEKAQLKEWEM